MQMNMRQLIAAVTAVRRENWDHTSHVLSLLHNINRDPKRTKASSPSEFHPVRFAERKKRRRRTKFTADVVTSAHERLAKERPVKKLKAQTE